MMALCLVTAAAGFIAGGSIAAELGHAFGTLHPLAFTGGDWPALVLTMALGLLGLEVGIATFEAGGVRAREQLRRR